MFRWSGSPRSCAHGASRGQRCRAAWGDLIGWRERRQLTQAQAAKLLGVGRSTFERTEREDIDTPLGRKLQRALLRYTEEMNTLPDAAPAAKRKRRSSTCGF